MQKARSSDMNGHERVRDLAAEYALGVLDPTDRQLVAAHVAGCADCRRQVQDLQAVGGALACSLPPLDAPPALRARILAAATARPQEVVSRRHWGGWALGIAAAAVAVAVGIDDAHQRRELTQQLADLTAVEQQLALQQAVAQPVLDGQRFVRLAPVSGKGPSAIWVRPAGKAPYLAAPQLPPLQPDRTYELWFLQGNKPVPAGTFLSGAVLTLPALPSGTTALAITVEPHGGSPAPTSSPIMIGTV
jgi:anti-sigma-K factor RskA